MKDDLGDRIKSCYEDRTRVLLPRRSYTIIRIDGKAFHTFTKGLQRPFDDGLIEDMNLTAAYLCKNIMGAKFAFVQSDEISLLLTDFGEIGTQAWFDNNLQKMCSVSSSMATSQFNRLRYVRHLLNVSDLTNAELMPRKDAEFDSRVFQIPQQTEVENYFIWRQGDAVRNSISSVAQSLYSHNELHGKNNETKQEMIFQKGINWNNYPAKYKQGRMVVKETYEKSPKTDSQQPVLRTKWVCIVPPIFTQERPFLERLIPDNFSFQLVPAV